MAYIEVKNEYKRYQMGETTITANDGISFEVEKGEVAVILGPSGAGKSTVLNILGGMDSCDEGEIIIDGTDIAQFSEKQLTTYRRNDVARYYVEETGQLGEVPSNLQNYIDYQALGRDMEIEGNYLITSHGVFEYSN